MDLLPAADRVGRRLRRPGVQHARAAYGSHRGDEDLHGLSSVGPRRQQRDHVAVAAARHELRELHGPVRVRRDRTGRHRGGGRHGDGRAAGGDRQRPAPARVSEGVRRPREASAASSRPLYTTARRTRSACRCAANTSISPTAGADSRSSTSRSSTRRAFPRRSCQRRYHPLGPEHQRRHARGDGGRRARPRWRSIRCGNSCRSTRNSPFSPVYRYIYIADRQEGLVLSTAATLLDGNPTNNFLKRAATFNPNGQLNGAVNLADRGQLRLHAGRPRARRRGHQHAADAQGGRRSRRARDSPTEISRHPVPLRVHHRRRRLEGRGHHVPGSTTFRAERDGADCPGQWDLRGPHVCLRRRRPAGAGDRRRRASGGAVDRPDVQRERGQ